MKNTTKHPRVLAYLKRTYSNPNSLHALDQPTFITIGRRATIFLGTDWIAGNELARALLNRGYTVTYRVRKLPEYEIEHIPGKPVLEFTWPKG